MSKGWNLMCNVDKIVFDVPNKRGYLYLPVFNSPDMGRTIKAFTSVDPEIEEIQVFMDGVPDIKYRRYHDDWVAL